MTPGTARASEVLLPVGAGLPAGMEAVSVARRGPPWWGVWVMGGGFLACLPLVFVPVVGLVSPLDVAKAMTSLFTGTPCVFKPLFFAIFGNTADATPQPFSASGLQIFMMTKS